MLYDKTRRQNETKQTIPNQKENWQIYLIPTIIYFPLVFVYHLYDDIDLTLR